MISSTYGSAFMALGNAKTPVVELANAIAAEHLEIMTADAEALSAKVRNAGAIFLGALSQVGLVFLMFSIGLGLSLRKMRRLGPGLMLATFGGAIVMYYLSRLLGVSLGWSATQGVFLAGMLMVSSSAVISKILQETGTNHERSGHAPQRLLVQVQEHLGRDA